MTDEEYWGSKEEDMAEEGRILEQEQKLCPNCLKKAETKGINGVRLCEECRVEYPEGMPF